MSLKNFFKIIYLKIIRINDSPHKIAGGFALGVFLGILPGAGLMASVVIAYLLRVNRAAALAGSLLTNSWLSVITFVLAIKVGAWLTSSNWRRIYSDCRAFIDDFHWQRIFDGSSWAIIKPLLAGYAVIGLFAGVVVYVCVLIILVGFRRRNKKNSGVPAQEKI